MDTNIINDNVTISRLTINKKSLTKAKLYDLSLLGYEDARKGVCFGELAVISNCAVHHYAEAIRKQSKSLGISLDNSLTQVYKNYSNTALFTAIILYNNNAQKLYLSWFHPHIYQAKELISLSDCIANLKRNKFLLEGITDPIVSINKLHEIYEVFFSSLSPASLYGHSYLEDPSNDQHMELTSFERLHNYLRISLPNDYRNRYTYTWVDEDDPVKPQLSYQDSQEYFDRTKGAELDRKCILDEKWHQDILISPYMFTCWSGTQKWVINEVEIRMADLNAEYIKLKRREDEMISMFENAPYIEL